MMRLSVITADPAGNITLLVRTPVMPVCRGEIARRLLKQKPDAEQVGFLTEPRFGGDVRLEMMGGEFCGNALRAAGLLHAVRVGNREPQTVAVEISGCAGPLLVRADPAKGHAWAQMPLPKAVERLSLAGEVLDAVRFEGILQFVRFSPCILNQEEVKTALHAACGAYGAAAAGLMEYDEAACTMRPAVYVCGTDSLYYERSCASGSAAVAALKASQSSTDSAALFLRQPGGVIEACAEKENGALRKLSIGGAVTLGEECETEV